MAFDCPACGKPSLEIVTSVQLGPGDDDDERNVQRIRCACGLVGAAYYTASRRGSGDSWHHEGHVFDTEGETALAVWFSSPFSIEAISEIARPVSSFRMTTQR